MHDFLEKSEFVFITQDSTTMISQSVCSGVANVYILELKSKSKSKFHAFLDNLQKLGLVRVYKKWRVPQSTKNLI